MYEVVAGYVTVETNVGAGRAHIDIPRGAELPADVPAEQVQSLLALGAIKPAEPKPERKAKPKAKAAKKAAAKRTGAAKDKPKPPAATPVAPPAEPPATDVPPVNPDDDPDSSDG